MSLIEEYFRVLDAMGHERFVWISQDGVIDNLLKDEPKLNEDIMGFTCHGYKFTYLQYA